MRKDWLKLHILELIGLIAIVQFVVIMLLILFKIIKSSEPVTLMILSNSITFAMIVLNYYFGSSKGSKDKQYQLDKASEQKNEA